MYSQPFASLSTLSVSSLAVVGAFPRASEGGRGDLIDLPRGRHSAYKAIAQLVAQYLGNEEENIPVELLEMLRNGDLYKVSRFA